MKLGQICLVLNRHQCSWKRYSTHLFITCKRLVHLIIRTLALKIKKETLTLGQRKPHQRDGARVKMKIEFYYYYAMRDHKPN